jgi:transposase InsO family protein
MRYRIADESSCNRGFRFEVTSMNQSSGSERKSLSKRAGHAGNPRKNGYRESFNGKLRDECLNGEIFYSLEETKIVIEKWRMQYNT